jgi:chaperonin GroES
MSQESLSTLDARIAERDSILEEQEAARAKALQLEAELARGFVPLADRVVIRKTSRKETAGGIALPETTKKRPTTGTVVAIGPDVKNLSVGDVALFMEYAGVDIDTEAGVILEAHIVCTEDEIFGVWRKPAA